MSTLSAATVGGGCINIVRGYYPCRETAVFTTTIPNTQSNDDTLIISLLVSCSFAIELPYQPSTADTELPTFSKSTYLASSCGCNFEQVFYHPAYYICDRITFDVAWDISRKVFLAIAHRCQLHCCTPTAVVLKLQ